MLWKKNLFSSGSNAQNGLILHTHRFLDVLIPMAQVLRLYIQMFLSYGQYVCIILETAHHRTTFRIFCNFTQKTIPEENSCKMFHISSPVVLFSYGKVKDIFWIRIKFHLGRAKKKVRGDMGGEAQMRVIFTKFTLSKIKLYLTNIWSDKLLTTSIAIGMPKTYMQQFSSDLSSSWAKTTFLCILRNKYGFQIVNAMEEINSIWTRKK